MMRRAVFLDRDDTIVADVGYAHSPDQMRLLPGAAEAISEFKRRGYLVVLITNQSGVGRGYFTEADLHAIHEKLQADLADADAELDAIYYCPHLPPEHEDSVGACDCRKPKPGMIMEAAEDLNIDLERSYMIGDSKTDVQAGRAAGCRTGLVRSAKTLENDCGADLVVEDLLEVLPHLNEDL